MKIILSVVFLLASNLTSAVEIQAKSWLIADAEGKILESENIDIVQPIASITKLMTAMIILDANENLTMPLKKKFKGLNVNREQLLHLAVIKSDNTAAKMLCENYHRGYKSCIDDMNYKSKVLGMENTEFHDSSGLDNRNVSTPKDLIKLLLAAEKYPLIVSASNKAIGEIVKHKKKKILKWKYSNTNPLVTKYDVLVSKTGYVRASGGCLVMSVRINNQKRLFVVLNSKTTRTRIHDMDQLIISVIDKKI